MFVLFLISFNLVYNDNDDDNDDDDGGGDDNGGRSFN